MVLENVMLDRPEYWQSHYHGDGHARRLARGYSYSDRVRYYWPDSQIDTALAHLVRNLADEAIPLPLISQYLPLQYVKVREGRSALRRMNSSLATSTSCSNTMTPVRHDIS